MVSQWSDIINDPKFEQLSNEDKQLVRDEYFKNVLEPSALSKGVNVNEVRDAFNSQFNYVSFAEEQPVKEEQASEKYWTDVPDTETEQALLNETNSWKGTSNYSPVRASIQEVNKEAPKGNVVAPAVIGYDSDGRFDASSPRWKGMSLYDINTALTKDAEEGLVPNQSIGATSSTFDNKRTIHSGNIIDKQAEKNIEETGSMYREDLTKEERVKKVRSRARDLYTSGKVDTIEEALKKADEDEYRDDVYTAIQAATLPIALPVSVLNKLALGIGSRIATYGGLSAAREYATNIVADVVAGQEMNLDRATQSALIAAVFGAGAGAIGNKSTNVRKATDEILEARQKVDKVLEQEEVAVVLERGIKRGFDKLPIDDLNIIRNNSSIINDEDVVSYATNRVVNKTKDDILSGISAMAKEAGTNEMGIINSMNADYLASNILKKSQGRGVDETIIKTGEDIINGIKKEGKFNYAAYSDDKMTDEMGKHLKTGEAARLIRDSIDNLQEAAKTEMGDVSILAKARAAQKKVGDEEKGLWDKLAGAADDWLIETGTSSVGRSRFQQSLDLFDFGIVGKAEARSAREMTKRITKENIETLKREIEIASRDASEARRVFGKSNETLNSAIVSAREVVDRVSKGNKVSMNDIAKANRLLDTKGKQSLQELVALTQVDAAKNAPKSSILGRLFSENIGKTSTAGFMIAHALVGPQVWGLVAATTAGRSMFKAVSTAQYKTILREASKLEKKFLEAEAKKKGSGLEVLKKYTNGKVNAESMDRAMAIYATQFAPNKVRSMFNDEE